MTSVNPPRESGDQLQIVGKPELAVDVLEGVTFWVGRQRGPRILVTITRTALYALPHQDDGHTHDPLERLMLQEAAVLSIVARKLAAGEKSDTGVLIDESDLIDRLRPPLRRDAP